MTSGIFELALVVGIAAVFGALARFLRQPIILAYLATGFLIGALGWTGHIDRETFHLFSDLGVMFLLFLVGIEINYDSLRLVGRQAVILGLGQIVFTFVLGFGIAGFFGWSPIHAAYIAIALTFSSTIVVVKLLSEKRDLNSLYGRLAVGILIVQDIVVVGLLMALAGFRVGDGFAPQALAGALLKGAGLFAFVLWFGRNIFPWLIDRIARSHELLFIISLAWVLLIAAAVSRIGFSLEIAGLMAGVALAGSSEHFQIAGRIKPLRDFFMLVFFVLLGATAATADMSGIAFAVVVFSLFVLIGNPLVVMVIMGIMGYRKRTAFLTGVSIAQISEFSLVLAALGRDIGHLTNAEVSLVTAVGIVTLASSSYLIAHGDAIFRRVSRALSVFERKTLIHEDGTLASHERMPFVLVGAHRTGQSIALSLPRSKLLIVDFDPEIIGELRKCGFHYLFGDIADPAIFELAGLREARLVISTSPDLEDNLGLLKELKGRKRAAENALPKIVVRAETEREAELLYGEGADYVFLPNFTAGQYLGKTIAVDPDARILEQLRARDLAVLKAKQCFTLA